MRIRRENKQRETIYSIGRSALEGKEQKDYALSVAEDIARELWTLSARRMNTRKMERHSFRGRAESVWPGREGGRDRCG